MPADTVGEEIRHLRRDKGYPQRRAVAAALSIEREGRMKKRMKKRGKKRAKSRY